MSLIRNFFVSLLLSLSILGNAQEGKTILENLKADNNYSTFVKGLELTGLDKALENKGDNYTVFAPNNQAFEQNKSVFNAMFQKENIQLLTQVIGLHLSKEPFGKEQKEYVRETYGQEGKEFMIKPLMGRPYQIVPNNSVFMISSEFFDEAYIIDSNEENNNGSFHTISRVLVVK